MGNLGIGNGEYGMRGEQRKTLMRIGKRKSGVLDVVSGDGAGPFPHAQSNVQNTRYNIRIDLLLSVLLLERRFERFRKAG